MWWEPPRTPEKKEDHQTPFYQSPDDLRLPEEANGHPTAVFHGLGDACIYPGMGQIDHVIAKKTGQYVKCIEVGLPTIGEYFNNFEHVAEVSCKKIAENKNFHGEFNVMGLSQGGLLARYIVEECDMPGKVRNMVTLGGPHMGVDGIPGCNSGFFCSVINFVIKRLVYLGVAQNWVAPAGYFRDVNNLKTYEKKSVFLPALNNEQESTRQGMLTDMASMRKERFQSLNQALFVKFSQDTVIYPKETAWFQELDQMGKLMPLNTTEFYVNDFIGLKNLTESGRAHYQSFDGDHLQFTMDQVEQVIVPFLNQ